MQAPRLRIGPNPKHAPRALGQGAVEFALVLPVLLLLLLIAVDFGRLFFTYVQLNNGAREAAAYAAANLTTDPVALASVAQGETNTQAQQGQGAMSASAACVDASGNPIACATAGGGAGPGNQVVVSVSEPFAFFTPLIGNFWPGGLKLATSATAAVLGYAPAGGGTPPGACTTSPTPSFTWSTPDTAHPDYVSFDATASTPLPGSGPCGIIGYYWDFGDGTQGFLDEGETDTYTYAADGTYTVTLQVQNAYGSATTSEVVTVGAAPCQPPTATFTVVPAAQYDKSGNITNWQAANNGGQQATLFTFDGSASANMGIPGCHPHWSWDLGDGTTPTTSSVSHSYAHAYHNTTVHVTLTVTNDGGTDTSAPFAIPLQ